MSTEKRLREVSSKSTKTFATGVIAVCVALASGSDAEAATIFESGTLGPTGQAQGTVAATNITPSVFTGVRFELTSPVVTTQVGGHFVDLAGDAFFGAIVQLDDQNDFPDSGDLSTPDVIGHAELTFPVPSNEVFGDLSVALDPGWYALVFGSGLFDTNGDGAAPRNNPDTGSPAYIGFQPGAGFGWSNLNNPIFRNHRFVVRGTVVPEPSATAVAMVAFLFAGCIPRRRAT